MNNEHQTTNNEQRNNTYVAIMAGGIGSRFWPASRVARPKQFMDILGVGKSLLRLTFERFLKLCPAENIFIVTNEQYKGLVQEHLPELTGNQILSEPSRNNTGPCVAYTSFKLHALDPSANFVVAPSDHIILKEDAFIQHLQKALEFTAANDALVTLGITPTRPDTGYGYVHFDKGSPGEVKKVFQFTEKPDLEKAQQFLDSGDYLWNAGIFVWSAESILASFQQNAPDIYGILCLGSEVYNTDEEQDFINRHYPTTPNISVDYAILERSANVYTLPADIGWSDLGTWASLHDEMSKDAAGNVLQGNNLLCFDTSNCLIRAPQDKLIVTKDLDGYIVVDEGDVLLIWPKDKEQEIKTVTKEVERRTRDRFV